MTLISAVRDFNPWWIGERPRWSVPSFRRDAFSTLRAWLESDDRRAQIVVGPRQVGKTVLLRQLATAALDAGWPGRNLLYFEFKDKRVLPASPDEVLASMPQSDPALPRLVICDEVTRAEHWWNWLGRAVDDGLRVVVADSSAATMRAQRTSGDSLQGRWSDVVVEGLSFTEFLALRGRSDPDPSAVGPEVETYLNIGGFPEHARADSYEQSWDRIREDLTARAIGTDLANQGLDVLRVEQLFAYLIRNSGGQLDERKICSLLGASRNAVVSWLAALESTLLVQRLASHQQVPIQRLTRGLKPKFYASEPSLVQAFALPSERPRLRAALFECAVYKLLRRRYRSAQILFVPAASGAKKRRGGEIDFLVDRSGQRIAIEVTTGGEGDDKATSLHSRRTDLGLSDLLIVTDGMPEREHHGARMVPLHRLLFEPERYLP